tara:strand:+ start:3333 stop:3983 length:651 start_codon:yes stop_codon:yes gene_type:complete
MKIAASQSNYLPWTGMFELINSVDKFVFMDTLQFTTYDWRTRNYLNSNGDRLLFSVPVRKHKLESKIIDIDICNQSLDTNGEDWRKRHYRSFNQYYSKSKYFDEYVHLLDYLKMDWVKLYKLNRYTMESICDVLGITTQIYYGEDLDLKSDDANERAIEIVKRLGGNHLINGPRGANYMIPELYESNGIKLEYIKYKSDNHFTVLDNIFNNGVDIL